MQAIEKAQAAQVRQAGESAETLRWQLSEIRAIARKIDGEWRAGAKEWQRAHEQFEAANFRLPSRG